MNVKNLVVISCRYIQTVKPHTPLIRFRKGVNEMADSAKNTVQRAATTIKSATTRPVLEDYQLPFKYRRIPLDETEINIINSGGVY